MKRTKENNALALQSMENLQSALNLSVATNAELKKRGEDLLKNVNNAAKSEKKEFAVDLSEFVQDCKGEVARMRSSRKPITDRLMALQKKFTLLENEITSGMGREQTGKRTIKDELRTPVKTD